MTRPLSGHNASRHSGRAILLAHDVAWAAAFLAACSTIAPNCAFAYVDPSVMTYTIQALAGVAVALSAVFGVMFRRTRRKLMKVLNIDENANKIVDDAWHRTDGRAAPESMGSPAQQARNDVRNPQGGRKGNKGFSGSEGYRPSLKARLATALPVAVFTVLTLAFIAPYEIAAASEGSLVFGIDVLWPIMATGSAAIAVIVLAVLLIARGSLFNALLMAVFSFGLGCYVQAMFLNTGLPQAAGDAVQWNDYTTIAAVSLAVWLVVFAVPYLLSKLNRKATQGIVSALSLALVIVQFVGVASLSLPEASEETGASDKNYVLTDKGMFDLSQKNNVIVFTLDMFDTQFLQQAVSEDPDLLNELTGFTWYQDSVGSMIPTRYGNVFLLTGQLPLQDEPFSEFIAQRYPRSTYLDDISSQGYSIGIYTDTIGVDGLSSSQASELVYDKTINVLSDTPSSIDNVGSFAALMKCALYRDLPWVCKPFFWFYTDEINQQMISGESDQAAQPYLINDPAWYQSLTSRGLTANDEGASGAFRYIHLLGAHYPYNMDDKAQFVGLDKSSLIEQSQGAIFAVSEYIRQLKELGLYDDATIIITADHGTWYLTENPLDRPTSPIMLVKPSQSAEEASEPIKTSNSPVWAPDVLATVVDAMGGDGTEYGTVIGETPEDADRKRLYYMTTSDGTNDVSLLEYSIEGDVSDFSSWHLTGREIPVKSE